MNFMHLKVFGRLQIGPSFLLAAFLTIVLTLRSDSQQIPTKNSKSQSAHQSIPVPLVTKFSRTERASDGLQEAGVVGLTFGIFAQQEGGSPLWIETQNVRTDQNGRYTILLASPAY